MFHLLPPTLARVADLADKKDSTRFALGNVHLTVKDGRFTADATDAKRLIRVTGPCVPSDEFPAESVPGLATAPNGATSALVPADRWKRAFAAAEKLTRKVARSKPVFGSVAVSLGADVTTFGATDTATPMCETVPNGAGRFPPVADILGRGKRGKVLFAADPKLLADVLRTVAEFTDEETLRVTVRNCGPGKPLFIEGENAQGVKATGLIMPLSTDGEVAREGADDSELPGVEPVAGQTDDYRAERDALRARVDELERELAAVRAARLAAECDAQFAPGPVAPVAPAQVSVAPAPIVVPVAPDARPLTRAERIALMRAAAPAPVAPVTV